MSNSDVDKNNYVLSRNCDKGLFVVDKNNSNSDNSRGNERSKVMGGKMKGLSYKCFYTNAQSLRNKKDELTSYVIEENLDIICITESWVNEAYYGDTIQEFEIDGYKLYLYQRTGRGGGGVALYVRNSIESVQRSEFKFRQEVESLWVDIFIDKLVYRFGAFYRPPAQNEELNLAMISEIEAGCRDREVGTIIIGDFNFPDIDWGRLAGFTRSSELFIDCLLNNFLNQVVCTATRFTNILDLLLVNEDSLVNSVKTEENLGCSDHNIIRFNFNVASPQKLVKNEVEVLDFRNGDFTKFESMLSCIDWESRLKNLNCYEMWDTFKSNLDNIQLECFPVRKIRTKNRKPFWWNCDIRDKIRDKRKSFKRYKENQNEIDLENYRKIRNELNQLIRRSKRLGEINLARNNNKDPKKFFSFYRFKNKNRKIGPVKSEGKVVNSDSEMVNIFNKYFASVFTDEKVDSDLESSHSQGNYNLTACPLEEGKIKRMLDQIDCNKSAGPDEIYGKVLKEGSVSIAKALYLIFNRSLEFGEIPEDWKLANVVPIFKKGDREDIGNYRPVSLTSLVVKILEKILKGCIEEYFAINGIFQDSQHGFRRGRSCQTNLLEFMEFITDSIDRGEPVDIVYLDFSKAFDKVPHMRLMHKLSQYGIGGVVHKWIKEWLRERKQRVVLNGKKSSWENVKSGVPQGSVLGPLLFLIYINDLDRGLDCKVSKFADDTKIACSVRNIDGCIKVQQNIDKLVGWADKWQMNFNNKKCKVLHVGYSNKCFNYEMNGDWLESVEREKDLGIVISSNLKVSEQCLEARNRANRMLGIISRNVSYKSREVISKLYNGYVRPVIEYCAQVWSPYLRKDIEMLEAVQRRATRMISGLEKVCYAERLKELGMFSVERRFLRGDMIQVFKIFTSLDNIGIEKFFQLEHNRVTRGHVRKIAKKPCHLDVRKYFFSNRVVNFWNSLPEVVVSSDSLPTFKRHLDHYMDQLGML